MLKEFVEYIVGKAAPNIINHNGREFSDKKLYEIEEMKYRPERDVLPIAELAAGTLTSIVDFIGADVDGSTEFPLGRKIIHIVSPNRVTLTSELNGKGNRQDRLTACCDTLRFPFDEFMDREMFNIHLQTQFVPTDHLTDLLATIGSIADGTVTEGADDGVTQSVTVKQGIQRKGTATVPNPVILSPYRTFPEVEQPTSPFVFRLKSAKYEGEMPKCALFESDGSLWKVEAMDSIFEWFVENLDQEAIERGEIVIIR